MRPRRFETCGFALALAAAALARPERASGETPRSPLVEVRDADPLDLARVAARLGDGAVLASLAAGRATDERLAAARAAPWLDAPERALALLVDMLVGRDSVLAPAAAKAVVRIAASLDADALARREVVPGELTPVRARLLGAAERSALRADLRAMAGETAAQLAAAGVP